MQPAIALAAAVAGLHRKISEFLLPMRPGMLRLLVDRQRSDSAAVACHVRCFEHRVDDGFLGGLGVVSGHLPLPNLGGRKVPTVRP